VLGELRGQARAGHAAARRVARALPRERCHDNVLVLHEDLGLADLPVSGAVFLRLETVT
jgi:hypothetical protein